MRRLPALLLLALLLPSAGCVDWVIFAIDLTATIVEVAHWEAEHGEWDELKALEHRERYVWGGPSRKDFLGCLNCPRAWDISVRHPAGPHGPEGRGRSLWDPLSAYGAPVSEYSACDPHARNPPEVRDELGIFLGRLTVSKDHPEAIRAPAVRQWLKRVCRDARELLEQRQEELERWEAEGAPAG